MPFDIPEDLSVLDDETLAAALEAALAEAAEFDEIPDADLDEDKLSRLIALADFATAARTELDTRSTAAADRSTRAQAAREALRKPVKEDEEVVEAEIVEDETEDKPPVAASGRKVPVVARAATNTPTVEIAPARPTAVLTASADVPGYPTGGSLADLDIVGKAMLARMKGLPSHRLGGERGLQQRYSVAAIDLGATRTDGLIQTSAGDDQSLVVRASQENRLPGGSLTAAGGWCAPSETLYDLCVTESTDGLLDLPSVTVNRGGIRFTKGPSFNDIYDTDGLGWFLTEAEVIAGDPEKTCIDIECPPFTEVRLDAVGICIRAPLLTQAAYPELVRRWIEGALIALQHKTDVYLLSKIDAQSPTLNAAGNFDTTVDSLAKLEILAEAQRQKWRSSFGQTFEVLAPAWYRSIVRADLARRNGIDMINTSDAQIEAYFTARNLRVQWLANLEPITATGTTTQTVTIPDEVTIYMFPSGTFVKGTTDVINLDAVYDSQTLLQNAYTALFAETGVLVVNTCWDSIKTTLTTCATGRTGAADLADCVLGA